jgi:hypothetical protein
LLRSTHLFLGLILATALAGPVTGAHAGTAASAVVLSWTTPGDDSLTGTASAFDMRYSTSPLLAGNFTSGTKVNSMPAPAAPGTVQTVTVTGLSPNTTYYFAMKTVDKRGNWSLVSNIVSRSSQVVGVADHLNVLDFSPAYPNPARRATTFSFSLQQAGPVRVEAYDISGRHVRTLLDGRQPAGRTDLSWNLAGDDGRPLEAGVYLVHASVGQTLFNRRVTIVR